MERDTRDQIDTAQIDAAECASIIAKVVNRLADAYAPAHFAKNFKLASTFAHVAEYMFDLMDEVDCREQATANLSNAAVRLFIGAGAFDAQEAHEEAMGGFRRFPWDDLEANGFFFLPTNANDAAKTRLSAISAAWKRYGPGAVKTKCTAKGVAVKVVNTTVDLAALRKTRVSTN